VRDAAQRRPVLPVVTLSSILNFQRQTLGLEAGATVKSTPLWFIFACEASTPSLLLPRVASG
jgi:hypothetical protein